MKTGIGISISPNFIAGKVTPPSFKPSDIANLELELDYRLGITTSGGKVTDWDDQSGQGNDFIQTIGADQPTWGTTEVDFSVALTAHMIAGSNYVFSSGDGYSISALVKTNQTGSSYKRVFDFGSGANGIGLGYTKAALVGLAPSELAFNGSLGADANYHTLFFVLDFGTNMRIYHDNVLKDTELITLTSITAANIDENPTRIAGAGPMTIGWGSDANSGSSVAFKGGMKALYIHTKKLTDSERLDMHNYMTAIP